MRCLFVCLLVAVVVCAECSWDSAPDVACETTVDEYNDAYVYPLVQKLLEREFFKYYKVNLNKACPFWSDERECGLNKCGIESCDDELPAALRENETFMCISQQRNGNVSSPDESNKFDPLDTHISNASRMQLHRMEDYEDEEHKFCDIDDEDATLMHYVNLSRNPERYTGYKGNSAQRVWRSIYQENCFKPNPKFDKNFLTSPSVTGLCLEKRIFYRVISGLHTSITVAIAANNYVPPPGEFGIGTWQRNVDMFKARFSPETTSGEGPTRLSNLYFVYLLELRALHKLAPYLRAQVFFTGNEKEDAETRLLMKQLHEVIEAFPNHLNESAMFRQECEALARELRNEFRVHFWNISRIMDCVDCDKCRLWGKLQTHGLGTAFKVLFSDIIPSRARIYDEISFSLTRNDLVALLQSFGRFATGVHEVRQFKRLVGM